MEIDAVRRVEPGLVDSEGLRKRKQSAWFLFSFSISNQ